MKIFTPFLLAITLFLFYKESVMAQTNTVYYSYDDAGNRDYRGPEIKLTSKKSAQIIDSTATLENQPEENLVEEKLGETVVKIYPNPTRGQLRVEITGFDPAQQSAIYLYTLSGTMVTAKQPLTGDDVIDLSSNPLGTYILKLKLGEKVSEWKVIKE